MEIYGEGAGARGSAPQKALKDRFQHSVNKPQAFFRGRRGPPPSPLASGASSAARSCQGAGGARPWCRSPVQLHPGCPRERQGTEVWVRILPPGRGFCRCHLHPSFLATVTVSLGPHATPPGSACPPPHPKPSPQVSPSTRPPADTHCELVFCSHSANIFEAFLGLAVSGASGSMDGVLRGHSVCDGDRGGQEDEVHGWRALR
jgi:hypothetical protein